MCMQSRELAGKWALILGASSGFGAATARALAGRGMNIFGVHMDRMSTMPMVEELIAELKKTGVQVQFFNFNAADPERRQLVLADIRETVGAEGGVRVLMHSLAFGALRPFIADTNDRLTQPQMEMTNDVMAHSLVYWVQDLMAQKLLESNGRIYAMTSSGGSRVWTTYGAVSAAKAALESHIRQLALELAPMGITANAIRAGVTDTPALRKIPGNDKMIQVALSKNPMGRLTTPEDVAACIAVLAEPDTYWMTGNVLGVDGGEDITG